MRIYYIRTEDNWDYYYPTLKAMRAAFSEHIADGAEPDTGHIDYEPTRAGVCRLLNLIKPDGD